MKTMENRKTPRLMASELLMASIVMTSEETFEELKQMNIENIKLHIERCSKSQANTNYWNKVIEEIKNFKIYESI